MDVGKSAKRMGQQHPRVLRRIDPEPIRPTPGVGTHKPKRADKRFGFSYEARRIKWKRDTQGFQVSDGFGDWERVDHWSWYDSAKKRDQAIKAFGRPRRFPDYYRDPLPIERETR